MSATTSLNFEAGIAGLPPNLASFWGFRSGEGGSHSSRTIMLDELTQLFGAVPEDAPCRMAVPNWPHRHGTRSARLLGPPVLGQLAHPNQSLIEQVKQGSVEVN